MVDVTTIDGIGFEYLQGDCVVEINRYEGGEVRRFAVLIEHGPCGCAEDECAGFDGTPMHERLAAGDVAAWREVERVCQLQMADRIVDHEELIVRNVPA